MLWNIYNKSATTKKQPWERFAQHWSMTAGYTELLRGIQCLGLVNFRMWHLRFSTPPSWNISSLASSRFFRMERCNSFKRNQHRCVLKTQFGLLLTLTTFHLFISVQQQLSLIGVESELAKSVTEVHHNTFPEMSEHRWIISNVYEKLDPLI